MAESADQIVFGPFRCDPLNACVWQEEQAVSLPPKAFDVLLYLLRHPGQLVSKEDLLKTIWAETYVGDAVLKVCIGEIRKALADDAKAPQFIETVHRRGYRFIASLSTPHHPQALSAGGQEAVRASQNEVDRLPDHAAFHPPPVLVGREGELARLHQLLEKALRGERQIVFVTGEPGIGKTTLIELFLQSLKSKAQGREESHESKVTNQKSEITEPRFPTPDPISPLTPSLWVCRGQCVEHYGAGEAYLPVLEALGALSRPPRQEQVVKRLEQYAPTWLVQMPALTSPVDRQRLRQDLIGTTSERMLREGAEALEALTSDTPLILVLEDLHWSDYATLDLVAALARRREPARLLVIGTYRPVDVIVSDHPLRSLKQELQGHGQCQEFPLGLLTPAEVATYLTNRFSAGVLPEEVVDMIYQRTDGNPLFLTNVVEYLIAQGVFCRRDERWELRGTTAQIVTGMPESTRQMIERQIEQLTPDEQRVLEAASAIGMEFPAAAVDAALEEPEGTSEEHCERLVRQQRFLHVREPKTWPDSTVTGSYAFTHALYQSVLAQRVAAARRLRLHQRIGGRLEAAYGAQTDAIAAELAVHFDQGRDYGRAIRYLQLTAENAVRRCAHREALRYLIRGLNLLPYLPDTSERLQHELRLQATLGPTLMALKGTAAHEVEQAYQRAQELCRQTGETATLFPILRGLFASAVMQGKLATGRKYAEQLLRLAQSRDDSASLLQAHYALGMTHYRQGKFVTARAHLEKCQVLYDSRQHFSHTLFYGGSDPGVGAHCFMAWTLWYLGYADRALDQGRAAETLAQSLAHPYSQAFALNFVAWVHKLRREVGDTRAHAEAAIAIASEHGYSQMVTLGTILRGWALIAQGHTADGLHDLQRGIEDWRATGTEDGRPYFLALLADAYGKVARVADGLSLVNEAIAVVNKNGERVHEAHVYHLKGRLLLAQQDNRQPTKDKSQKSKIGMENWELGSGPIPAQSPNPESRILDPDSEAEACFQHALQVARQQKAKALELHATVSLSRLWAHTGKQRQAQQLLTKICGWFTEAHSTADLREARDLLGQW